MESSVQTIQTMQPIRIHLQSGNGHCKTPEIINILLTSLSSIPEPVNQSFLVLLDAILLASNEFSTSTRRTKPEKQQKLELSFTRWNKHVNFFQSRVWSKSLPTINTKVHHSRGLVKEKLDEGFDTLNNDSENGEKSVSLCTHGNHIKKPCCVLRIETLIVLLETYFDEPEKWFLCKIPSSFDLKTNKSLLVKCLSLKCQQLPTEHCRSPGDICGARIPLQKLLQFLPTEERKKYTVERIYQLILKVSDFAFPGSVVYCQKNTCRYAELGIYKRWHPHNNPWSGIKTIECVHCKFSHGVHDHKVTCPDKACGTTFCAVCKISPYHDLSVCQGPRPVEMDEDLHKLLCETTRPCPSCSERTEKTGGCDHMTCKCGTHWCWRCLQTLDPNDPYRHTCLGSEVAGRQNEYYREYDIMDPDVGWPH